MNDHSTLLQTLINQLNMAKEKLLSIIIPSYNMEVLLPRCLNSLIVPPEQMEWLDVLIVNDGSKDSTSAIGHEYAQKYPDTFRVIDKQNGHYGSCINAALPVALGKYIRILDADDYFDNAVFRQYLDQLKNVDVDVVVTDYNMVDAQGQIVSRTVYDILEHGQVITIQDEKLAVMMMHGLTYRTDHLRRIHYKQTEGILYTDSEWSFIPLLDAETLCYFKLSVYQYLVDREGQSMSKQQEQKNYPHRLKVLRNMLMAYLGDHRNSNTINTWMTIRNYFINIYMIAIVKGSNHKENQQLVRTLDEELKSLCPDLYESLGDYAVNIFGTKYRVIDQWRKHKMMNTTLLHQLVRIDNIFLTFKFKLKKLLK